MGNVHLWLDLYRPEVRMADRDAIPDSGGRFDSAQGLDGEVEASVGGPLEAGQTF
jgi:hypothetical protein